jgi:hypothetical protein
MSSPPGDPSRQELGEKLLSEVAEQRLQPVLQALNEGADVNYRGEVGETALIVAAMNLDLNIIRLLLEKGADKSIRASPDDDFEGRNALETAEHFARDHPGNPDVPEIIRLLSLSPLGSEPEGGAKKNKKKKGGRSVRNKRRTMKKRARKTRKSRK